MSSASGADPWRFDAGLTTAASTYSPPRHHGWVGGHPPHVAATAHFCHRNVSGAAEGRGRHAAWSDLWSWEVISRRTEMVKTDSAAVRAAKHHIEAWSHQDWETAQKALAEDVHVTVGTLQPVMGPVDTI